MSRLSKILAAASLDALYALVPEPTNCTGSCVASCGPIGFSAEEGRRMAAAGVVVQQMDFSDPHLDCVALDGHGRCTVYSARPMICRLWGSSKDLPCMDQACYTVAPLTSDESRALLGRSIEIGNREDVAS